MEQIRSPVIVLREFDGKKQYLHGLVERPKEKSEEDALKLIDEAFERIKTVEDWNYDDLFRELEKLGFCRLKYVEWWEPGS